MNILFVHEVDWNRRVVYEIHELSELLSLAGHNVYAISYESLWKRKNLLDLGRLKTRVSYPQRAYPESSVQLREPGVIKIPIISRVSSFLMMYKEIEKTIKMYHIEVIVLYSVPTNGLQVIELAKKYNIPVVFRSIDVLSRLVKNKLLAEVTRRMEGKVYSSVDATFAISPRLSDYVSSLGGRNIRYFPLGVETSLFTPEGCGKWSINVICFIGTLYNFSGLDLLLRKFWTVLGRFNNARIIIVGDGEQREKLESIVDSYNLHKFVAILGNKPYDTVPNYINMSDICVVPFIENEITRSIFPTKILQYMACGKPVVASALPGIMSVLKIENGILFAKDIDDMARKIVYLLNNRDVLEEYGKTAREYVLNNHSYSVLLPRFVSELEKVISEYSTNKS